MREFATTSTASAIGRSAAMNTRNASPSRSEIRSMGSASAARMANIATAAAHATALAVPETKSNRLPCASSTSPMTKGARTKKNAPMVAARSASPSSAGVRNRASKYIAPMVTSLLAIVCAVVHAEPEAAAAAKPGRACGAPSGDSAAALIASCADEPRSHVLLEAAQRVAGVDHELGVLRDHGVVDL